MGESRSATALLQVRCHSSREDAGRLPPCASLSLADLRSAEFILARGFDLMEPEKSMDSSRALIGVPHNRPGNHRRQSMTL